MYQALIRTNKDSNLKQYYKKYYIFVQMNGNDDIYLQKIRHLFVKNSSLKITAYLVMIYTYMKLIFP